MCVRASKLHRLTAAVGGMRRGLSRWGKCREDAAGPGGLRAWAGVTSRFLRVVVAMWTACLFTRAADTEGAEKAAEASVEKAVQEWQNRGEPVPEALRLLKDVNAAARASAKGIQGGAVAGKLLGLRSRLFESACARATPEELHALGAMIPE